MLNIYIEHHSNESVSITKITDEDKVLSEIENNCVNLDVCKPYIGQDIKVHHIYTQNTTELLAKLDKVEIDSITGAKCIKYFPKN